MLLRRHLLDVELVRRMHGMAVKYDTWYWAYSVQGMFNKEQWADDIDKAEWLKFGFFYRKPEGSFRNSAGAGIMEFA